jgi:putative peptide zinc metalloprotease protein
MEEGVAMVIEQDSAHDPLRLADGTELLGEYYSPGVRHTQHLVRRRDGQLLQLPPLLYAVAASLDGERDIEAIAARATTLAGRELSADNVHYLIDAKLRPTGLLDAGHEAPPLPHATPLLGLRLRFGLVPERAHRAVTTALRPLFRPFVVVTALVALLALDVWLFVERAQVVDAGRQLLYRPQLLLLITGLTIASAVFHETGHATAARYGGATPGVMGAGVYLIWPVFYTDVTDSYRLDRRGRLRTDLGGVYFNVLFTLGTALVYAVTGFSPLLVFLVVAQIETLQQFLPFVRLDGYYVVSDLIGVPNLFVYMGPVLVLLTRRGTPAQRRAAEAKLANLKPWARRVIRGWVFLTAPILAVNLAVFLLLAPAVAGAAWGSLRVQAHELAGALHDGRVLGLLDALVGIVILVAPAIGMTYVAVLGLTRLARSTARWHRARPVLTTAGAVVLSAALVLQLGLVWPRTFESALHQAEIDQPVAQAASRSPAPPTPPSPSAAPTAPPPSLAIAATAPPPPSPPPPTAPPAAPPPIPPATCGARPPEAGTAQHPGRRTWLEQVLCEAATA